MFIYQPYGKEHGWQARAEQYLQPKSYPGRAQQLAWLRQQWKDNPCMRQQLRALAKQVKVYKGKAWRGVGAAYPVEIAVVKQAVYSMIRKGVV